MFETIKVGWTVALDSGEFTKTTGVLYNDETGGHCCLGVLTRLYGAAMKLSEAEILYLLANYITLPPIVAEWAGLFNPNGAPMPDPSIAGQMIGYDNSRLYGLSIVNDTKGKNEKNLSRNCYSY